ncbi:FAD/NAD P-binding domain-containing protein [Gloeophyllum trabeum ATCC 11539]|uniref:FAD/NAD P-binding domain-containing protein n=1 Tax=Gloeophyllum trabeum (strain ATCC 11539 / FP-39264 / Madison 617) TaxID=670483 RepID=S7PYG3_GLOTA|nr:FAD/NAD P-binding domain-containing protein [Gloeophyllum trabeum ATCC 11539]EPQ52691.1 FAD/NAD P-binding domain-containing protein [Gloeophyllum trabeum ATCC 11539]
MQHETRPTRDSVFAILNEPVDVERRMKVIIVGSGFAGLAAAYRVTKDVENMDLVVYEKNSDVGGVWYQNRYPGITCDVPSHGYQFSYAENTQWSKFYAPGSEIFQYLRDYVVICATGGLDQIRMPDIAGLGSFKGKIVHTASWDMDPAGSAWVNRRVAVIGYGASATQVVPALQPHVAHMDNYVRGRTWIFQPFVTLEKYDDGATGNHVFTEDEKRSFKESPEQYKKLRLEIEDSLNPAYPLTQDGNDGQAMIRPIFESIMKRDQLFIVAFDAIPSSYDSPSQLSTVNTWPRLPGSSGTSMDRLISGKELTHNAPKLADNVHFVNTKIHRVTEDGIETVANVDSTTFQVGGPNSGISVGSLIPMLEKQAEYITTCILKMQRQRIKVMTVQKRAVDEFQAYIEAYFPRTVFSKNCSSWYKDGKIDGRVIGLWPGSTLHHLRVLEQPRFEDYEYTYLEDSASYLRWLGNGLTVAEVEGKPGTRAWYV